MAPRFRSTTAFVAALCLTTLPGGLGTDAHAGAPPAHGIVYLRAVHPRTVSWKRDLGPTRLWVVDPSTDTSRPITGQDSPFYTYSQPTWSPDGSRIAAIARARSSHHHTVLVVIDADGTHERVLTSRSATAHEPAWSPDGRFIAFTNSRRLPRSSGKLDDKVLPEVWIVPARGGHPRKLFPPSTRAHWGPPSSSYSYSGPSWSRDGRWIAFDGYLKDEQGPWLIRPDGHGVRRVGRGNQGPVGVSWAGNRVFYRADDRYRTVRADGGDDREIPIDPGFDFARPSRSGDWLCGRTRTGLAFVRSGGTDFWQALDPDGQPLEMGCNTWSPDSAMVATSWRSADDTPSGCEQGRRFGYQEPRCDVGFHIWTFDLATRELKKLGSTEGAIDPQWDDIRWWT